MTITTRKLTESDWKELKALRLEGLKKHPSSFCSSYAKEKNQTPKQWKDSTREITIMGAFNQGTLVGMIGYYQKKHDKIKHHLNLCAFYVSEEHQNQGIGKKLIMHVLARAKQMKTITSVKTEAICKEKSAVTLYKRCGFTIIGMVKKELKIKGKFYDEYLLQKMV